jgi:predicted unusual protein kinase regulating ubiquinone biosynthesis (AarF/ABC1/UbiB family)
MNDRETTELVLQIIEVTDKNGLKLPREFGLLMKQALYFDRYQKLLAPAMDPIRDPRVRASMLTESYDYKKPSSSSSSELIVDTNLVEE